MKSGQEFADMDSLQWFNFLAFDIIGDLVSDSALGIIRELLNQVWLKNSL